MEVIKLSREDIESKYSKTATLKEIVAELENQILASKRVVCRVSVNGMALSESDEERLAQSTSTEISKIELEVEAVDVLVTESLGSLIEFMQKLKDECVKTAEAVRSSTEVHKEQLAMGVFNNTQWVIGALIALKPQVQIQNQAWSEQWVTSEIHMVHTARELAAAFDGDDFNLVADVLEYELYNSLDKWRELLKSIKGDTLT